MSETAVVTGLMDRLLEDAPTSWVPALGLGITKGGEAGAVRLVESYLVGLDRSARVGVVRAAAIWAAIPDATHRETAKDGQPLRVGHILATLADRTRDPLVAETVAALPMIPVDGAALALLGLVQKAEAAGLGMNYLDLTQVLAHWSTRAPGMSHGGRAALVFDFHG